MRFGSDSPRWMVSDEHDEMIERFAARLRPLPEIDPAAKARVLVAVAAERERDREHARAARLGPRILRWTAAAAMAAALVISAVLVERGRETAGATAGSPAPPG